MVEVAKKFNMTARYGVPNDGEWWGWIHPPKGVVGEVRFRGGANSRAFRSLHTVVCKRNIRPGKVLHYTT